MTDVHRSLTYLFDRPLEPMFTLKGEDKVIFRITEQFLPDEYKGMGVQLNTVNAEKATEIIGLNELKSPPNLSLAKQLATDAEFCIFLSSHQEMAAEAIDVMMSVPQNDLQQFLSTCVYCRVNLNPQLFNYAYSIALMHRRDTRNVPVQNFAETFPSKFLSSKVFSEARETTAVIENDEERQSLPIYIPRDFTATNLEEEHRLAFFREDIGINLHHWHWHLVYPVSAKDKTIVAKDRRGELFFYMHQQIVARYNCERLNNSLKRVEKFSNWTGPIREAYFPKLDSVTSSRGYPPRQAFMTWQDIDRPADKIKVAVKDLLRARKNLEEAVASGLVKLPDNTTRPLDIDTLGNLVESSDLSPNRKYYGNIHNHGHLMTSFIHDPVHRYLESFGMMGDVSIAMRDPFFYRWHAWVDDLFQRHKESSAVPRYTNSELEYQGVQITSVTVESSTGKQNEFSTFWMQSDVDLSRGLDFAERGAVYVRFTHLNHRPFSYRIMVDNQGPSRRGTVRIFLAPKFDERNLPWALTDQRKMFVEMDRFVVLLNAGANTITRKSTESSVTIPFEQTFRDLSRQGDNPKSVELTEFNFCGCGWPQHMLVPSGTTAGAPYQLFVMVSNYELDKVEQINTSTGELSCREASSFCGLKDKLYPDKRAMGFPFDRPSSTVNSIEDFKMSNVALVDCTIRLETVTEQNPRNPGMTA